MNVLGMFTWLCVRNWYGLCVFELWLMCVLYVYLMCVWEGLVSVIKDLTILMFPRSGYKDLLGTPKRLLLRLSGNIMIISRGRNESIIGTLMRPSWSLIEMKSFWKRRRPYLFRYLSRVISRLNVLGEPRRGTKFYDFLTLPPLYRDPVLCVLF